MPSRLPDRNKSETVRVPRTIRVDEKTFFKGSIVTDEVTAQKIRRELKRDRVVRPYIERGQQIITDADEGQDEGQEGAPSEQEDEDLKTRVPKAKEHL